MLKAEDLNDRLYNPNSQDREKDSQVSVVIQTVVNQDMVLILQWFYFCSVLCTYGSLLQIPL